MAKKKKTKKRLARFVGDRNTDLFVRYITVPVGYCPVCGRKITECICNGDLTKFDFELPEVEGYIEPPAGYCPVCGCRPCRCNKK